MMSFGKAFAEQDRDKDKSRDREEMRTKRQARQKEQNNRDKGGQHRGSGGGVIDRFINNPQIAEKLNLTNYQLAKLKKLSEQSKVKQEELQAAMKEAGRKQAEMMSSDKVDRNALKKAGKAAGDIRTEIGWLKMEELLALKEILTKEQSQTMKEMRKNHQKKGDDKRGGDMKRRGGEDRRGGDMKRRGGEEEPVRSQEEGGGEMFTM
jgi:Spy/CpxP family protein refolding chaperone